MDDPTLQLTINDIAACRNVIDAAFKRGAFGASEAREIGILYEKLDQFVTTAIAQAQEAQAPVETQPQGE
jgi:hypothetical protein